MSSADVQDCSEVERNSSTSLLLGNDVWAPIFVAARAPAAEANLRDSVVFIPSVIATIRAPQKVSPAAVVSVTRTLNAG